MPVKGLMILSTRHPLTERFRTDPAWRKWSLYTKVLENDTGNLGYILVTIACFELCLCGDVHLGCQELLQAGSFRLLHLKKFHSELEF